MPFPFGRRGRAMASAFTLLELVVSALVVGILATMLMPVFASLRARAERANCTANLRSLHVAANLYIQDHKMWPQIEVTEDMDQATLAQSWIDAFSPYGLAQINWICPTIQHLLHSPDLGDPVNRRIDYASTSFNDNPQSPFRWAKQPWFIENGNLHGNGSLMIFPDGHVSALNEIAGTARPMSSLPAASPHP